MPEYYDTILVAISASLLAGVLLGVVTDVAFSTGLLLGSLTATVFVYDAMFRNPPLPSANPETAAAAVVWHAFLVALAVVAYAG